LLEASHSEKRRSGGHDATSNERHIVPLRQAVPSVQQAASRGCNNLFGSISASDEIGTPVAHRAPTKCASGDGAMSLVRYTHGASVETP
jgi:hypothetical protein